jgi:hypothetical protein
MGVVFTTPFISLRGPHHTAIHPDHHCKLCSLHEPMDTNHLGQRTALSNETECERYWEVRTKLMESWLCYFIITTFFVTTP